MNKKALPIPTEVVEPPKKSLPKPYLLTRIAASFLDFLLAVFLFVGFEAAVYFTLFDTLGYHRYVAEAQEVLRASPLYVYDTEKGFQTITETYNVQLTPEENYDVPIIEYYTSDARAITDNCLYRYNNSKIVSGLFVEESEGVFVRDGDATDAEIKTFLTGAYDDAVAFLESDPVYVNGVNKSFYIIVFSCLFSATLAMSIIYLLIPLLMKNGQTPFKLVFRLCLVDARDETRVKRRQLVYRFLILLFFNIWIPILLFANFTYFTLIPVFVTVAMMSFSKSFSGPHDYVAKTYIVSARDVVIPEHSKEPELIQ